MILDNTSYDKIKIICQLSQIIWFIDRHGLTDAQSAGDQDCVDKLVLLKKDLEKHLEHLQKSVCAVSQ